VTIEAGQQLLHYRLIEKIGEGGMGVVWKAEDQKLHRSVALKVLPEATAVDPERRGRFEREARAVAALNHPNIVTLHSVEEVVTSSGSVHFITMELVEGQTLTQLLPRNGFPLNRLLGIAIPLADAVSGAHRAGITHRDLKPDNVMIDGESRLRVLDFGLAKLHDPEAVAGDTQAATVTSNTVEGRVLGTVAYMSPEQAEGKNVDARSDVFSLGTILYEMASGTRPFQGETTMSTISAILRDEPTPISETQPSLPRHAWRIIRRCLAKEPDRRYQSALELRNELEELKHEVDTGENAVIAPGLRVHRKWGWTAVGIAAVLAVAVTWAIKGWLQPQRSAMTYVTVPITSAIGEESSMNWSPEGEFIAYGLVRNGSADVMVQPVAGGEAEARASGPGDETTPRWSPDGKYLAYLSTTDSRTPVYLVPPHGGASRKLIDTDIATLDIETVAGAMGDRPWSADSRTLLVTRITDSGRPAIYRVDRDTEDAVQLSFPPPGADDSGGSYSFDGERIVFERRRNGRGALMTLPAEGGEPQVLLADAFDNARPSFRPDDLHLVFSSNRNGSEDLWEIDPKTGAMSQLTFDSRRVNHVAISATNRIAYEPFWHDTFLFVVDVATGEKRQLTSHTMDNFGARFSPDGRTIAYHSTRAGNSEIFLYYLDGSPETQITDDSGWDLYPDWSPDGRKLIFNSNREDGRYRIIIANSDGGGERVLLAQPVSISDSRYPVNSRLVSRWSPDGKRIAYLVSADETASLWTVGPDGDGAKQVIQDVTSFDWYRDSRHAIYARRHGSHSEMIAVDLETGEERSLFVGPFMEMDVAPDGSAVAFCFGRGHMSMGLALLKLEAPADPQGLPRAVGEPEYVVRTEGTWHVHNGGWSPDSSSLVYTRDQDYGDIFELVEKP
jgi:Tol biopolymer transport system component